MTAWQKADGGGLTTMYLAAILIPPPSRNTRLTRCVGASFPT